MVWPRANFSECASRYMNNPHLQHDPNYIYHGTPINIPKNNTSQVSYNGCLLLCEPHPHTLPDFFPFVSTSQTLTTWVFPAVGVILQAPFESNEARDTIYALMRWVGNPMSSFAYILWNIRMNSKAALMVDMSFPAGEDQRKIDEGGEFGFSSVRDSFYILTNMNQFVMTDAAIQHRKEAEELLRIALFSKDLRVIGADGAGMTLVELRRDMAKVLRRCRKHGIIPVFASTLIFLIAFALSLQLAFGELGVQEQAHDLALGLFLAWLPVLILATIVDRNFSSTETVREILNKLVYETCKSISDPDNLNAYFNILGNVVATPQLKKRIKETRERSDEFQEFFKQFAGQGRVRWHYGAAQPILTDLERAFIAERGRYWMEDPDTASTQLVLGSSSRRGIWYFNPQEIWQICAGFLIVFSTILGAMGVSYYTPTIGLGCRSGGYMIFLIIAILLLLVELFTWWLFILLREKSRPTELETELQHRLSTPPNSTETPDLGSEDGVSKNGQGISEQSPQVAASENPGRRGSLAAAKLAWANFGQTLKSVRTLERYTDGILKFLEACNFGYLVAFVIGDIIGAFQTCYCLTSMWGSNGGYLDFDNYVSSNLPYLKRSWGGGTAISLFTMLARSDKHGCISSLISISMAYIVTEWCLQSHLSAVEYEKAWNGLIWTRWFRKQLPVRLLRGLVSGVESIVGAPKRYLSNASRRKRLRWTWDVTYQAVANRPTFPQEAPERDSNGQATQHNGR